MKFFMSVKERISFSLGEQEKQQSLHLAVHLYMVIIAADFGEKLNDSLLFSIIIFPRN